MKEEMKEILVKSKIDGSLQPNLFYQAEEAGRPLLVGLHTWSHNRFNQVEKMLPVAKKNKWNLLLPEFRGANFGENPNCTDACGSEKAKQDIIDAIEYIKQNYKIDESNILLLGASGGGHMALLMAAYAPKLWKAIGSFVPITDIGKWYDENPDYREAISACCKSDTEDDIKAEYQYRSPITYVDDIAKATLKIFSGKWDPIVPCSQGLNLYNEIFTRHPDADVYFEMFDGGHEMRLEDAERWLLSKINNGDKCSEEVTN